MKLLILTNIPSPYRVNFFNELGKLCDLTVLLERKFSDERDDSWKTFNADHFNAIFLKGMRSGVAEAFCPSVIKYLKKGKYNHIIVTNFSDLTGIIAIAYMRANKISYGIESDGGYAGNGRGIKEKLKKWLLKKASFYFSTAVEHDNYYITYGATPSRIFRYPFTSLYNTDILLEPVSTQEKEYLRSQLRMYESKIILSVGRFIHRKGYDVLFEALSKMDSDIGCYIVGGKPTEEYISMVDKLKLNNVHFVDFKCKQELEMYYKAADVFVLPTREDIWGLVVNEAMAKGLSVVTTNRCIAGVELIGEREIGQIVPVEDPIQLAQALTIELNNIGIKKSREVLGIIREYSYENMAYVHINMLKSL